MPTIGVEFETDREKAERRVEEEAGSVIVTQEVTDDGNFYNEVEIPYTLFGWLRNKAEDDPEATITKVNI